IRRISDFFCQDYVCIRDRSRHSFLTALPIFNTFLFGIIILIANILKKTVTQFCRQLVSDRPLKDIRDEYNYPKKKGIKDECSRRSEERRVGKECRDRWWASPGKHSAISNTV